jgi:hypothetical protein
MALPRDVQLSNQTEVAIAWDRLMRFCQNEYDYYDALPNTDPNRVEPLDVLATVSVNSFIQTAERVNWVHKGMSKYCDGLLAEIPVDSNILTCTEETLANFRELLHAAIQIKWVLIPVATKVLHRKRPNLIPMLDNVVLRVYCLANDQKRLLNATQDKRKAADAAMIVVEYFRQHLESVHMQIDSLRRELARNGFHLSPVRILEILIWIAAEPNGYYRNPVA